MFPFLGSLARAHTFHRKFSHEQEYRSEFNKECRLRHRWALLVKSIVRVGDIRINSEDVRSN